MSSMNVPAGIHTWSVLAEVSGWDKRGVIRGAGHETIIVADTPIVFEGAWNGGIENCYVIVKHKYGVLAKRDALNSSCNGFHMNNVSMWVDSDATLAALYLRGTELTSLNNVHVDTAARICTGIKVDSELRIVNGIGNTTSGHYWRGVHVGSYNQGATNLHLLGCVTDMHISGMWLSGSGTGIHIQSRDTYQNVGQMPRYIDMDHMSFEGPLLRTKITGPQKPYRVKIVSNYDGVVLDI